MYLQHMDVVKVDISILISIVGPSRLCNDDYDDDDDYHDDDYN